MVDKSNWVLVTHLVISAVETEVPCSGIHGQVLSADTEFNSTEQYSPPFLHSWWQLSRRKDSKEIGHELNRRGCFEDSTTSKASAVHKIEDRSLDSQNLL